VSGWLSCRFGQNNRFQGAADPEKLQTVMRIAFDFHKNHTYTMEGEFVCIVFDNPAPIKKFEFIKKKANQLIMEAFRSQAIFN